MKLVFAFLCCLMAWNAGATSSLQPMIINGHKLTPDQVPQMTLLNANGQWRCTATLIGPRVIITAAHCMEGEGYSMKVQKFGPINGQYYDVTLTRHPDYTTTGEAINIPHDFAIKYDLAVGILDRAVTDLIPMSVTRRVPSVGETVMTFGFGSPTFDRQYGSYKVVTVSSLGATVRGQGQKPQIGAPGDSGGPNLFVNDRQEVEIFGISSTSTQTRDYREIIGWPEAIPYTEGVARVFPAAEEKPFFEDFVKTNALTVCGVNLVCGAVKGPSELPKF